MRDGLRSPVQSQSSIVIVTIVTIIYLIFHRADMLMSQAPKIHLEHIL